MTITEQYKHPEWQKKRLKKLEEAEFACEFCGDTESTLHVHHGYYEKGKKVWEYEDKSLHVLCDKCHERGHKNNAMLQNLIAKLYAYDLDRVIGYVAAVGCPDPDEFDIDENYLNPESLQGIHDYYREKNPLIAFAASKWVPLV